MPDFEFRLRARLQTLLPAALIAGVCGWIYWPALRGEWIWDDTMYLTENPLLRSSGALRDIWRGQSGFNFFPITETVQWLQWCLWGAHPLGYHITNLILHVLAAWLFWRLLAKLGGSAATAWLGALLFAVHPVAVESVAWISELKNTLSLPPLLLAALAYLEFEGRAGSRDGGSPPYLKSLAWFLVALLCKSTVVMLPFLMLLYAWVRRGRIRARDLAASGPFFALAFGLGLFSVWFEHHGVVDYRLVPRESGLTRVAAAGLALAFYLGKCLVPFRLAPMYPRWPLAVLTPAAFLPGLALLAGGSWLTRALAAGRAAARPALLGLGWFALNAAPVLGLIGMAYLRISRVADHFAYLPLLGIAGLLAAVLGAGIRRRGAPIWIAAAILAGAWAAESRAQAEIFRSEGAFWHAALQRNPQAWMAHYNLGNQLREAGRLPEALAHYQAAARIAPDASEPQGNLGVTLLMLERGAEAIAPLERSVLLAPDSSEHFNNLAIALGGQGRMREAIAADEQALRLSPDFFAARFNLGLVLAKAGRAEDAITQFEVAARLRPDLAMVQRNWAYALQSAGRFSEASEHLHAAERLERETSH